MVDPIIRSKFNEVFFYYRNQTGFFSDDHVDAWATRGIIVSTAYNRVEHQRVPTGVPKEPGCYVFCVDQSHWESPVSCDFLTPAGSPLESHEYVKRTTKSKIFWTQDKTVNGIRRRITFAGTTSEKPEGPVILQYIVPKPEQAIPEAVQVAREQAVGDVHDEAWVDVGNMEVGEGEEGGRGEQTERRGEEDRYAEMQDDDEDEQEPFIIDGQEEQQETSPKAKTKSVKTTAPKRPDVESQESNKIEKTPASSSSASRKDEKTSPSNESTRRSLRARTAPRRFVLDSVQSSSKAIAKPATPSSDTPSSSKTPKVWTCINCRNHGQLVRFSGHTDCPYRTCPCDPCMRAEEVRQTKNKSRKKMEEKKWGL